MQRNSKTVNLNDVEYIFESGHMARQANGAVTVRMGDTVVFATACATKDPKDDIDFLPLRIDYQEKFASAGKTLGGFIKREGRPSEREILTSRLIDRPLRPLFPNGYYHDTQILTYCLSYDGINSPDVLAMLAASAAVAISDIPVEKTLAAVRVGHVEGQFVINPTLEQRALSKMDLVLAGTEDAILMIEGYCDFFTEEEVLEAILAGHAAIKLLSANISAWRSEIGKEKKGSIQLPPQELCDKLEALVKEELYAAILLKDKQSREEAIAQAELKLREAFFPEGGESLYVKRDVNAAFKKLKASLMRNHVLDTKERSDGRRCDEVRSIFIEQSPLPRTHGSSLFTRGETQSLAICTLGGESMGQRFEDLNGDSTQRFYLQYFFPPFSVGEVGRNGPAGRREIGHGKLAERALQVTLPEKSEFPYVIRLESNILESNGSSSMASVCGGCLAMMDAGVPIKRPVSGIAMGLILEGDRFMILSDILGMEDALGDMDFKITGDEQGITAFQMDIKVEGITPEIMQAALAQAKEGRVHILAEMRKACPSFKTEMSRYAPRIETVRVKPSKIAVIIGPGGKQIRAIIEETGVDINIDDSGEIQITSSDAEGVEKAKKIIDGLVSEVVIGKIYDGKVVSVVPFGVFVEVLPGKEGLCHISELDESRVNDINDYIKVGAEIQVKVLDINERGQVKLSRKATLQLASK